MNIINTMRDFFSTQDWKLVIAGFGMITIFILIIYLISLIVISFQNRKEAVNIKLPDINTYNNNIEVKKQFEDAKVLEVELISAEQDVVKNAQLKDDENLFLTALSIETKKYIPATIEDIDMPQVGEIDYEAIKLEIAEKAREKDMSTLSMLKKLAQADELETLEENFIDININDGGAI